MFQSSSRIAACLLLVAATRAVSAQESPQRAFDHHVHVLSPRLIADWKSLGMAFSRPDDSYTEPVGIMSQAEIDGACLISMAHLYATEDFRAICPTQDLERRLVSAENDFVAVSVARSPGKLVGYYSVNLLRDYAFDELKRCRANPNLTGLKLHLPACGLELENQEHLKRLTEVLSWAEQERAPVLLHLTAGEDVDLERALWFWQSVIEPHPRLEIQLAHLGSVGGFNGSSESILVGYQLRALANPAFRQMSIYFDLSGAIIVDNPEIPATSDERCRRLSELMLRIGVDHFLFASDYPVFSIAETRASLVDRLALPPDDLRTLFATRARCVMAETERD
ncbi:MAG: amidohydrolase family protein [Planctomycetales bacterium]|nr:amidohydrolase family protein [Planctomycetales bacterium]